MWNRVTLSPGQRTVKHDAHSLPINPLGAAIIGASGEIPSSFGILRRCGAKLPVWVVHHGAHFPQNSWIVQSAVEHGADLNWRGHDGRTALQRALVPLMTTSSECGKHAFDPDNALEFVNTLVKAGAESMGSEAELLLLLGHWSYPDGVSIRDFHEDAQPKACKLSMLAANLLTKSIPRIERALADSLGAYDPGALGASVILGITSGSTGPLQQLIKNRPEDIHGTSLEGVALGLAAWHSRTDILDMLLFKIQSSTPALIPVHVNGASVIGQVKTHSKEELQAIISESFTEKIPVWHRETQKNLQLLCGSPVTLSIWSQECLDKLLENEFQPDRLTISVAVCHGDVEIVGKLVNTTRVDHSHADRPGPLYLSVERRFDEMTRVLLKAGISPNECNYLVKFGRSPLQKAVEDGNLGMMDLLLESGADVNAPAAKCGGATALQLVAITGRLGIAKRLIDLGANVNAPGAETHGRTALEGAAENGRLDMVQFLLGCGANIVGDGCLQYFKAIIFAEDLGHMVVARSLKDHRKWTNIDHGTWKLFIALDWDSREEL